ncbi:hypothetical protein KKA89_01785, partial [Patescibacteria group bacterium]|nr:hypothetical protein [Patescibacteria group bacterium]
MKKIELVLVGIILSVLIIAPSFVLADTASNVQAEIQTLESQITQLEKTKSGLNFWNDPTGVNKTVLNSLIKAKQLKIVALKKQLQEIQNPPSQEQTIASIQAEIQTLESQITQLEKTKSGLNFLNDPTGVNKTALNSLIKAKQLKIVALKKQLQEIQNLPKTPVTCAKEGTKAIGLYSNNKLTGFIYGEDTNMGRLRYDPSLTTHSIYYDHCYNSATSKQLNIGYCANGILLSRGITCPNGCLNGACKAATVVQPACTDSDAISSFLNGKNYNKLGTVTVNGNSKTDKTDWCGDWDGDGINEKVVEYFCDSTVGQGWRDEQYTCANGCLNGACKAATNQTNCTDSDGGDDPNTFGEVTYNLNYAAEYRQTVSDSCYGDSVVFERYCNSEGAQRTYSRTCSAGTTCQGGACKAAVVTYQCNDGIDNDGDTKTDYPNDPGCTSATDNDEYNPPTNQPPTISGVTGPVTLEVNQQGVWSVTASDPENGTMSYRVVWGDEVYTTSGDVSLSPPLIPVQQTTTFTHTYNTVGTYTPVFQVKDDQDEVAETSISVTVVAVT